MQDVLNYLSSTKVNAPFFLIVGDSNYTSVKEQLSAYGLKFTRVSDLCRSIDKRPNLDNLISTVDFADIDGGSDDKKIAVLGLGEYLALCGENKAYNWLSDNKDRKVGNARVVFLLRGIAGQVQRLQNEDPTRFDKRRVLFTETTETSINVVFIAQSLKLPAKNGIKELLYELEDGKMSVNVKSNIEFEAPLMSVRELDSAYDGLRLLCPSFSLAKNLGTEDYWVELLTSLSIEKGEMSNLIAEFGSKPENVFKYWFDNNNYKSWLYFIALKLKVSEIDNTYLKHVVEMTSNIAEFKKNIMNAIIDISHKDNRFELFWRERKSLTEYFSVSDTASFVSENKRDISESLYKLTDQTLPERQEFIVLFESVEKYKMLSRIEIAYPALSDYLRKYTFSDLKTNKKLNDLLTDYFDKYKWQKVLNQIEADFIKQVEQLAGERIYNKLRTRSEVINAIDKEDTFLYWIDALGVEFLGFIQKWCERKGLSLHIHIAQAELPTTTTANNSFFYNEDFKYREKIVRLDELKHKDNGGYIYKPGSRPIHLAEELDVISEVLEKARTKLALHQYKRVLIVSDHGASRLAVINEQEEKYEVDAESKGKHGGRCCKKPNDYSPTAYDLPFATESTDGRFLILANYGRFKGSRAANVEVHGGASLEEVVIPIIEISLTNPNTEIELLESDGLFVSFRKKLEFTIFSKAELSDVIVTIKGKLSSYKATKTSNNHHHIVTDITRPGIYLADVLDGDNLIGEITLNAQSETQKKSTDGKIFDDIF